MLLLRQFARGQTVLFAGAGFSLGARNARGSEPPDAESLAAQLAAECGWEYKGEDLPVVYDQAELHLGRQALRALLASLYGDLTPASWHRLVAEIYWHRIYTTNIDDLFEQTYSSSSCQRLRSIVCPSPHREADPWLKEVQCIHLHGAVHDLTKPLTFTLSSLAEQTASPNVWYQQFIEDMQSKSVVFVGTRLAEAPFYHYVALRAHREAGTPEVRAKAFVVAPQTSTILKRSFADQGYAVIDATAEEFLTALVPLARETAGSNVDIIKTRFPHMVGSIDAGLLQDRGDLLREFDFVSVIETGADPPPRSLFLLGAEPTWADIAYNLDASRGITHSLRSIVADAPPRINIVALLGPAGSGKSTCCRRLAWELARDGHSVYFAKGMQRFTPKILGQLADDLQDASAIVFIDDVVTHLASLNEVLQTAGNARITIVVADQSHLLAPRLQEFALAPRYVATMPHLNQPDSEAVLDKLRRAGLLGVLAGRTRSEQIDAFLVRARKQLLVAMKEATSGKGFDVILAQEYDSLVSQEAKMAYVVACLAHAHGPPVARRHLLACIDGSDLTKATVLRNQLQDVLIAWHENIDYLVPRHQVIAKQVIEETAPRDVVRIAIVRFIRAVAADIIPSAIRRRTPEYQAFRAVLRFDNLRRLFGDAYDLMDAVYSDIQASCEGNFLYWLQRGRLEVYFDRFETAQNYLDASLAIRENYQAWHYVGVLKLKRAAAESEGGVAWALAEEGEQILRGQIIARPNDAYPAAALVEHKLRFLMAHGGPRFVAGVRDLYRLAEDAHRRHPMEDALTAAYQEVWKTHLMLAVPGE